MSLILALDQGTTSSRAILFDHGGHVVAVAVAAYHGVAQRRDAALRAAQPQGIAATLAATDSRRRLILSGPLDANLDQAISRLRATLPPGYLLEES